MPAPPKLRMTSPRSVLPLEPAPRISPSPARSLPSSTTAGRLPLAVKLSSVLASIVTAPLMVGSRLARLMVCTPVPAMAKRIRSGAPPAFGLLFAAVMASRRLISPSAPGLSSSALIEPVSPSCVSAAVLTASSLITSVTVMASAWVLAAEPSEACTVTS